MIYLDNAATTRPCPACVAAVGSMLTDHFANPSSLHGPGIDAMKEIIAARSALADALGVERDTLTFTSGGTEANNLALFGAAYANRRRGKRIVTTAIEHESIIQTADQLEAEGFEVIRLQPDKTGNITKQQIESAITPDTILVSVMRINNEVGSILPGGTKGRRTGADPYRLCADLWQGALAAGQAGGGPNDRHRPQDPRSQGGRRSVCAQGRAYSAPHLWR